MWNDLSTFDRNILENNLESSAIYALAYSYERQILTQSGFEMFYKGTLNHWIFILFYFYLYVFLNHFGGQFKNLNKLESYFFKRNAFCLPLFLFGGADWGRYFCFVYLYYFYILFELNRNSAVITQHHQNSIYVFIIYLSSQLFQKLPIKILIFLKSLIIISEFLKLIS